MWDAWFGQLTARYWRRRADKLPNIVAQLSPLSVTLPENGILRTFRVHSRNWKELFFWHLIRKWNPWLARLLGGGSYSGQPCLLDHKSPYECNMWVDCLERRNDGSKESGMNSCYPICQQDRDKPHDPHLWDRCSSLSHPKLGLLITRPFCGSQLLRPNLPDSLV